MIAKTARFITVLSLALGAPLAGSQLSVIWNGGTGDWVDPAQ